jgi:hypothetical protein
MTNVTFENLGTFEGVAEWNVLVDGEVVATMSRERPTRWAVGARQGMARDTSKPWVWMVDLDGLEIPDGASLTEAKKLVLAHLAR